MTAFPSLTPSSRVFTLGDYSHAPLRTMGGTQTQVRHSNVIVGAGIELQFIGRSEADMLLIRTHYITSRGTFGVFTLPFAIWIGATDPTPASYTWRYTEMPRVSEDGNGHYDIAVKLEMMPPDPSGDIASTQDVVILVPLTTVTVRGLAPTIEAASGAAVDVPAAVINITGIAPTVEAFTGATVDIPAATIIIVGIAPTVEAYQPPSYTINLILDGSNGSTTITDSSANNFTATVNGNAQISTAQSVSGGASLLLDGTGDYVTFGSSSQFAIGTGDFEIAFDAWRNAGTNSGLFEISTAAGGDNFFTGSCSMAYVGSAIAFASGSTGTLSTGTAMNTGQWYRIRLARFGGLIRVSVDGVEVWSTSNATDFVGTYLNLGLYYNSSFTWNGYIDNFGMVKGGLISAWP
jgi:hypothetical protein